MDPPSYGRGANGEVWSIDKDLYNLVELCLKLLSKKPIMFAINTYTGGLSGTIIANLLTLAMKDERPDLLKKAKVVTDEIGIKMEEKNNKTFFYACVRGVGSEFVGVYDHYHTERVCVKRF